MYFYKKIFIFLAILFFSSTLNAETKRFYPEGKIRYFTTIIDDLGSNYNNTRPGLVLDLHFTYLLNKNFAIRSVNNIINYDDTVNDGTEQNFEFNQRLGLIIKKKNLALIPYAKVVHHDKNVSTQNDNSHLGFIFQAKLHKDLFFDYDYREETSNGSKIVATGYIYGDKVTDVKLTKKNLFFLGAFPIHLKIGQADGRNLRRSRVIKTTLDINKKTDLAIKYVDNSGKGIFKNNVAQNRNYLVAEFGYKF